MEPGVYLLQISGSLTSCTATVKLVSDQLEGELVSLSSGQPGTFRSRSTIFTVEDDDRDAEKIVVDICDKVYTPPDLSGRDEIGFHSQNFCAIFPKDSANFCFRFATEKIALCAIICKLHYAQNCAIPLLRYSVLRIFAEKFLRKRLNKGV